MWRTEHIITANWSRLMLADHVDQEHVTQGLSTRFVGQNAVYFDAVDSTNTQAKELARAGAPDGTLVIADSQTRGRGRLRRQWLARPGTSLLMSLILRPTIAPTQAAQTTMICSLALADAIEAITPLQVRLKWPNDILINGRKAGGILTELGLSGQQLVFVVVGIGLNVNVTFEAEAPAYSPDQAPDTSRAPLVALAAVGTSLRRELGHEVPRLALLQQFLVNTECRYEALCRGQAPFQEWSRRLETLGRQVTVTNADVSLTGWAEGVDPNGALLLRRLDGELAVVHAGDVTLRIPSAGI
jgi:BirA family transcriptional regulator, biotin operon repressor / biotin---[acetyl-CoA-carboxylase] ligase